MNWQKLKEAMINKILFAAGGTGGHIYPAIAIADELRKMNQNIDIRFIGAKGRIEEKIVPQNGYKLETIDISGFKRSLSIKNVSAAYKVLKSIRRSKEILNEFKPEIVYGTGGYVSGPVLRTAAKMGIPTVIEEGNYYPGVTVKLVSKYATRVILNFEGTKKYLKRQDNIEIMSYPVRENLKRYGKSESAIYFGLDPNKNILFVFGGSQGANSINNSLKKCFKNITSSGIQIIWQTGDKDFESICKIVNSNKNVKVLKYIDNIDYAYSASDLVLCRSGISTIMELASFGSAAVFVPFPGAAENHQQKNADALAEKNAAEIIPDRELDIKLEPIVTGLLSNKEKLNSFKKNIAQFSNKKAASKIANMLSELIKEPVKRGNKTV
ncbi:MAG: undecaprenyldiphospho-muramoylpentapeptide beta-N-acetylglucosaminyltransferase [Ignavibacteria bacterium]